MKITDRNEITKTLASFVPSKDGAFATCRCLPGQWEQANCQEWQERGTINGADASVYYMFENSEADVEDGGDMPWDIDHITHIEID